MNREQLIQYILDHYPAGQEHPWASHPGYAVFRHGSNRKWFALVMDIPRGKLGLPGEGCVDILNVKCDPFLVGSLQTQKGFYPAYHMNKESWITVTLDGSVDEQTLRQLLHSSFLATAPRR